MTPSPNQSDRELREAVAKLAEIVSELAFTVSADLYAEAARIAQSLRGETQEGRDA